MPSVARFVNAAETFKAGVETLPPLAAAFLVFEPRKGEITARVLLTQEDERTRELIAQVVASTTRAFTEFHFVTEFHLQAVTPLSAFRAEGSWDSETYEFRGPASHPPEETSTPASTSEKVLRALSNSKYNWRTIDGVSRETGLDRRFVRQVIESMPDRVIQSRVPDAQGRDLYTTRAHYKETHSPVQRLVDQLRSTSI